MKVSQNGLYQTLTVKDLPTKDMRSKQKKELRQKLDELSDITKKEAVCMLIIEHARLHDDYEIKKEMGGIELPYRGKIVEDSPAFYLEKLPIALKWILWRFMRI